MYEYAKLAEAISMATVLTYESEFSPNHQISLCLFRNVKNSNDLKQMLIAGKINACFIKPAMVRY